MGKTLIGLEITEESVRAVEVTVKRVPSLVAFGEVPLPPGAAKDSEILDADAVVLALRQLWSRAGFRSKRAVLGVGSRRVMIREHSSQTMRPDLFRRALPFQVQDLLPVPVDQAVLDFLPTSTDGDRTTGLLVAAVSETLEELVQTAAKAKVIVDRIDVVPFGLARTVRAVSPDPADVTAVIHIGDHTTSVVVVDQGVPRFVRIIPIDLATEAVRARLAKERQDAAQEALEPVGAGVGSVSGAAPAPATRSRIAAHPAYDSDPAVGDLVGRLRDTLAFYESRPGAHLVSAIHVSGAGAAVPGVMAGFVDSVSAPVTIVSASDILKGAADNGSMSDLSLNLVSTIGLVLGVTR
jgi:type IV pilus assembly protein PilM